MPPTRLPAVPKRSPHPLTLLLAIVPWATACTALHSSAKSADPEHIQTLSMEEAYQAMDDGKTPELTLSLAFPAQDCNDFQPHIEQGDVQPAFMCLKATNGAGASSVINHQGDTLPTTTNREHIQAMMDQPSNNGPSFAFIFGGPTAAEFAKSVEQLATSQPHTKWPKGTGPRSPNWLQKVRVVVTRAAKSGAKSFNTIRTALTTGANTITQTLRVPLAAAARTAAAMGSATTGTMSAIGATGTIVLSWAIYRMVWSSECRDLWHYIFGPFLNEMGLVPVQCIENAVETYEQLGWSKLLRMEGIHIGEVLGIYAVGTADIFLERHMPRVTFGEGVGYRPPTTTVKDNFTCEIRTTGSTVPAGDWRSRILAKSGGAFKALSSVYDNASLLIAGQPTATFNTGDDYSNTGIDYIDVNQGALPTSELGSVANKQGKVRTCPKAHHLVILFGPTHRIGTARSALEAMGYTAVGQEGAELLKSINKGRKKATANHQFWYTAVDTSL